MYSWSARSEKRAVIYLTPEYTGAPNNRKGREDESSDRPWNRQRTF